MGDKFRFFKTRITPRRGRRKEFPMLGIAWKDWVLTHTHTHTHTHIHPKNYSIHKIPIMIAFNYGGCHNYPLGLHIFKGSYDI
jgi:hypothetical protein